MKISNKFKLNTLFSVFIVLIIALALLIVNQKVKSASKMTRAVNEVTISVFHLSNLTQDYLLKNNKRAIVQWESTHELLSERIRELKALLHEGSISQEEIKLLDSINLNNEKLDYLFSQIVLITTDQKSFKSGNTALARLRNQLANNLVTRSNDMVFKADQLDKMALEDMLTNQNNISLFALLSIFILSLIMTTYSYFGNKSVTGTINQLRKGAQIIGKGNLDHHIEIDTVDEIGDLSKEFNKMAQDLRSTTVSRDKLSKEISERRKIEKEVEDLAKFPSENPNPILRVNADGIILYRNEAVANILKEEGLTEDDIFKVLPANLNEVVNQTLMKKQSIYMYEVNVGTRTYSYNIIPIPDQHYVNLYGRNITKRKQLEKSLLEAEENERQRIGSDLHDDLGQLLTGLSFKSQSLEVDLQEKSMHEEAEDARKITLLVDQAKRRTRELARGLLSMGEESLTSALKDLADSTEKTYKIPCDFECDEAISINNISVLTNVFRIAQEAVMNAVKHGSPDQIKIDFSRNNDRLNLTIQDNGIGMPEIPVNISGIGMHTMKYRANMIGALLDIKSETNKGTNITCIFSDAP